MPTFNFYKKLAERERLTKVTGYVRYAFNIYFIFLYIYLSIIYLLLCIL
jgi:hypothetical protein